MADDPHNTSNVSDEQVDVETKEDAETAAAREELKQTVISERTAKTADEATKDEMVATRSGGRYGADAPPKPDEARTKTPEREVSENQNDLLKDQVSSPKKKRAHDQLDEPKDSAQDKAAGEGARSEPEKKRPRDGQRGDDELSKGSQDGSEPSPKEQKDSIPAAEKTAATDKKENTPPVTSSTAFEKSGFAKLSAATTSPFGALGSSTKSVFGGASASPSPFGALGAASAAKPPTPSLSFGNGVAASPFASLNGPSKGFSSPFGGGSAFGSALSGGKPLSSFGKPGEVLKSDKPAKPFGAPESDAEDDSNEDDDEAENEAENEKEKDEGDKEDLKAAAEEKKKLRLQRVVVDDGEAGEVTILAVRAKMFYLDKITAKDGKEEPAWKERGVGNLKINVPEECVSFGDDGAPIPGSFDASELEDDGDNDEGEGKARKVVRLIMRQDSTLRVILNTTIVRGMDFQEKSSLKSTTVLFTAFEGETGKPTQIQMKMNAANAKVFLNEVEFIKRELES